MSQNLVLNSNGNLVRTKEKTNYTYHKLYFNNEEYIIDISSEELIDHGLQYFIDAANDDSIYSLMTGQYLLTESKRPDYGIDINKIEERRNNKTLSKELSRKIGKSNGLNISMIEIKASAITEDVVYETIFNLRKNNKAAYIENIRQFQQLEESSDKKYFTRYKEFLTEKGYKVSTQTLIFVAPHVTVGALNTELIFNELNDKYKIKCYTLQQFCNLLLKEMDDPEQFLKDKLPFISIDKHTLAQTLIAGTGKTV